MTNLRRPISVLMLAIVALLFLVAAWWLQDVVAPFVNEGEADVSGTVTFVAEEARYRVVTSGPMRPEAMRMVCDVRSADGTSRTIHAGDGSVTPQDRIGVSRVLELDARGGPTSVTCRDRLLPGFDGGRFQIVRAGGIAQLGLIAGGLVGLLAISSVLTAVVRRVRR